MKMKLLISALCLVTVQAQAKKDVWVYTSIYKEFIAPIEAEFEKRNPDLDVQVFQGGSEKIQAKIEAELLAKKIQADILLTSDPFWSVDLENRGLAHNRPGHDATETNYYSLMVIIVHKDFAAEKRPSTFLDLTKPEYKGLIQTGSPLESGTMFSTVAYLSRKYTWKFFEGLRDNNLSSNGGNSVVIQKVESGEKKVGIVLLENALAAKKRNSPIDIIYPKDGSIPIPSVQVILKDAPNKLGAEKFADFVLSKDGQKFLVHGFMYSVDKKFGSPEGALPLAQVTKNSTPWTKDIIKSVSADSKNIKKKFAELILE
jgi:iron(III) transport system substrate-binding protein